ncbi:TRAP-type mannitol/chloroaromatic compound transport system permease small subunit [Vibrio sp. ES.051]|uniref:TRAP transporter small permease subunit n=1 Tax=Vibrio sp. ES.051 TaxID=1761909 RepID=UPI000BFA5F89|nr:TRAP transporter small permease subunit [Vibrio sp. ES.051]PFG45308.1 TRAP-type mannitol/chloroaromatic compound transport system permease small subunit [Vibrio sp. ES.051]
MKESDANIVAEMPQNILDKAVTKVSELLSLLFVITVIISFYEVASRYLFNSPTIWVHETASFIGGSLFVIGGAYALATDKHVRVVLIYDSVSQKTRHYLNVFHHLAGLLLSGLLMYAAWQTVANSWFAPWGGLRLETSGSAWNPPFPALLKGIILFTVCLMFIQFILHLVREIQLLREDDND